MNTKLLAVLFYVVYYGATGIYMPYISVYLQQAGLSGLEIGSVMGMVPIIGFLAPLLCGWLSNRWNRELTVMAALFAGGACSLLLLLPVDGLLSAIVSMTVLTVFIQSLPPLLDGYTVRLTRQTDGQYGRYRLWGSIGYGIGGFAATGLTLLLPLHSIFAAAACVLGVGFWLALRARSAGEKEEREASSGQSDVRWSGWGLYALFLAGIFILQVANTFYSSFLGIYMQDMGADRSWIGIAIVISSLCELPFFYYASTIIGRTGTLGALSLASLMYALRWCLLGLFPSPYTALLTQLLHGITFCLYYSAAVEFVSRTVPKRHRTAGLSIFAACTTLASVFGNVFNGYLYDHGGLIPLLYVSAAIAVLASIIYACLHAFALRQTAGGPRNCP